MGSPRLFSAHRLQNEFDEGAHLSRGTMPRRIVGTEGTLFVGPIWKQLNQFFILQEISHRNGENLRDADKQPAPRLHREYFPSLVKLPGVGLPRQRIAQMNASVMREVVRMFRAAVALQIARRR